MPFAPHALSQECCELWRLQAAAKGLLLEFVAPETIPLALGDAARIRQVLNNLLGNAVKFTENGGVRLRLQAERHGPSLRLRWEIEDTGPGIAAEDQERIFDPFIQGDRDTTRRHGGTGIGLALCRELALLMGGSLRAESRPGEGSRFTLDLNLPRAEESVS